MEKSSALDEVSETSSLRLLGAHKKTAEELVDEMFDAVWLPKAGAPPIGKDEGNFGEPNYGETEDYDGESLEEESMQEESMEEEFESVETGVQNAVAGKIDSISASDGRDEDAERLERISKQIKSQLESNLRGVNWKRTKAPAGGLRLRSKPRARLRKVKRKSKRKPGSSGIYKSKSRNRSTKTKARKLLGPSTKRRHAQHPGVPPRPSAKLLMEPRQRAPLWAPKEAPVAETETKGLVLRRGAKPVKLTASEREQHRQQQMKEKAKRNPWYEAEMKAHEAFKRKKTEQKEKREWKRQRAQDVTQYLQSLPVEDWLETIDRSDLGPMLVHEGFSRMHDLLDLTEKELHMLLENHCGVTSFKERASFHRALRGCIKKLLTTNDLPPLVMPDHPGGDPGGVSMGDLRSIVRSTSHASKAQFTLPGGSRLSAELPPIHPGVSRASRSSDQYRSQMVTVPSDRANSVS